ncbi:hypothetical protein EZS27_028294 [termite gut metagenome]|uniref:Uncharacterized protein n=1 Tax=termite gut metagenome TaxID=433724 RepID=A0A5J4QNC2_9ZZZZ
MPSAKCLAEVCNLVNPILGIIPIHSEDSASYANLPIKERLQRIIVTSSCNIDGVSIEINQRVTKNEAVKNNKERF